MSDITKCDTQYCPIASHCWRKLRKADQSWQSYAHFVLPPGAAKCNSYLPPPPVNDTNAK